MCFCNLTNVTNQTWIFNFNFVFNLFNWFDTKSLSYFKKMDSLLLFKQTFAIVGLCFYLIFGNHKNFFGSLAMHSRKLFHLFRVSKSTPFSRTYIHYNTDVKICTNAKNQTWIFIFDFKEGACILFFCHSHNDISNVCLLVLSKATG